MDDDLHEERLLAEKVFGDEYPTCLSRKGIRRLWDRYQEGVFSVNANTGENQ